jgi:hypothetical protein
MAQHAKHRKTTDPEWPMNAHKSALTVGNQRDVGKGGIACAPLRPSGVRPPLPEAGFMDLSLRATLAFKPDSLCSAGFSARP